MIPSPGTGVQQRPSFTHTSGSPLTMTPCETSVCRDPDRPRERNVLGDVLVAGAARRVRDSRATTDCGETCPSPTATYSASRSGYFRSATTCSSTSSVASRLNGRFCLRISRCSSVAALIQRVLAASAREPLPDLVARPRRLHELEPVLARPLALRLRRQDLDGVARPQLVVERHELAVDLRADRAVADLGVDRVREVHRRRARRAGS